MIGRLIRAWFYRWWAVNRATIAEPYANWQASYDFTLWGESGHEILDIWHREGPFKTRAEADEVCMRMNSAALEGTRARLPAGAESPGACSGVLNVT